MLLRHGHSQCQIQLLLALSCSNLKAAKYSMRRTDRQETYRMQECSAGYQLEREGEWKERA